MSHLPLRSMPTDYGDYPALLRQLDLKGTVEFVSQKAVYPRGFCYWNVERHIREAGQGSRVDGWSLIWWPGNLVEAMHHAVYCDTDGKLLDVIQEPYLVSAPGTPTAFVRDSSVKVDLAIYPNVISKFASLITPSDPTIEQYFDFARQKSIATQAMWKILQSKMIAYVDRDGKPVFARQIGIQDGDFLSATESIRQAEENIEKAIFSLTQRYPS